MHFPASRSSLKRGSGTNSDVDSCVKRIDAKSEPESEDIHKELVSSTNLKQRHGFIAISHADRLTNNHNDQQKSCVIKWRNSIH